MNVSNQNGGGGLENVLPNLMAPFRAEILSTKAKLMILVVDDNQIILQIAQAILLCLGHAVSLACNGVEAVEMCVHRKYDIILMDMQMPVMGGVEATARIRQHEERDARKTIIVAMTATTLCCDSEKNKLLGFNNCLPKPFDPALLMSMLKQLAPDLLA
jgi:CheY-like chemotaxis protein